MNWLEYHKASSRAAAEAEIAVRESASERAALLYRQAAEAEENALSQLDPGKQRTLGITAVSAVALWCKAGDFERAKQVAHRLAEKDLPSFATRQIREMLETGATNWGAQNPEPVSLAPAQARSGATPLTDQELVVLALEGSEKAYRALLGRYQRPVFSVIHRIVRDREQAEELAIEAFLKVFNNLDRYDPAYKFSSWIYHVVTDLVNASIPKNESGTSLIDMLDSTGANLKPLPTRSVSEAATRPEAESESQGLTSFEEKILEQLLRS